MRSYKSLQNSQENTSAEISFSIKSHTGGIEPSYEKTPANEFCCEYCEILINNQFEKNIWEQLLLILECYSMISDAQE